MLVKHQLSFLHSVHAETHADSCHYNKNNHSTSCPYSSVFEWYILLCCAELICKFWYYFKSPFNVIRSKTSWEAYIFISRIQNVGFSCHSVEFNQLAFTDPLHIFSMKVALTSMRCLKCVCVCVCLVCQGRSLNRCLHVCVTGSTLCVAE